MMSLVAPLPYKLSKNKKGKGGSGRLLITVNVLGSPGPLRFLVNEEELVAAVIQKALRCYAREGRLPVLASNVDNMLLYCANSGSDALSPWEIIGSRGIRNFLLCKKQVVPDAPKPQPPRGGSWKAWFYRYFNFNISSR